MPHKRLYREGRYKCFLAKDLDEAYMMGFYTGNISRWELERRIQRHNPTLKFIKTETHCALWDTSKLTDDDHTGFICGTPRLMTIPKFSIMEYNFGKDRKLEYTNLYGEKTGEEILNTDEYNYKVLARGWEAIFGIVEKQGYKIDRRGL